MLPDLDERWGQQLNLYAYAANNPVAYTDEDGEYVQFAVGLLNGAREATRSAVVTFVASGGDAQATANAAIAGFSEGFASGIVAAATGNFLLANAAGTAVGVTVQSALENGTLPSAGEVGTAVATSLGVGAAGRALGSLVPSPTATAASVHGNSKSSMKPQHSYQIVDESSNGDVVKTGISGQPLNKDGTSGRANQQVNKFNKQEQGKSYAAKVTETNIPGRAEALKQEQEATNSLKKQGHTLREQKRPQPKDSP